VATVLFLSLAVSGCGSDVDRDATPDHARATSTSTSSAPLEPSPDVNASTELSRSRTDPNARETLRSALVDLVRANTGHFVVTVSAGGGFAIQERGRYRIRPAAYEAVRELTSPAGTIRIASRAVGSETWFRLESLISDDHDPQSWPCWVNYDDIAGQQGFPVELAPAPTGQPPAAVVAASYGVGKRTIDAQSIAGTMDLALVLSLVSNKLLVASGVDARGDATVPATFRLDGTSLSGFSVPLAELSSAIETADGDVPPELGGLAASPDRLTTRFSDLGAPVTFTGREDFESAMRSCGGS
jgi:hypothetical protein